MTISKGAEIFAEAIPAGVLQMYAFVQTQNRSMVALGSIVISALTTGFGSALISYDMDTSPKKRRETPDFYGFVPPTGRGFIFFLMVVFSTVQFLAKITAIALLGAVSKKWVVLYLLGDIVLYLLNKIIRNDFLSWVPIQSYVGSLAGSLLLRFTRKVRSRCAGAQDAIHPLTTPT
jgi:hypothetical protein